VQAQIEVKPSYGLTDSEIETMLKSSLEHAEDDMAARRLREQQVEADRTLEALQVALAADGQRYLDDTERTAIEAAAAELAQARQGTDAKRIKQAIQALEKTSEAFVARRMDSSIRQAMAGHQVDEFE